MKRAAPLLLLPAWLALAGCEELAGLTPVPVVVDGSATARSGSDAGDAARRTPEAGRRPDADAADARSRTRARDGGHGVEAGLALDSGHASHDADGSRPACDATGTCAPSCVIQGAVYARGAVDSTGCGTCDPATSATAWTPSADGTTCALGYCESATCTPGCVIAGTFYAAGAANPRGCGVCIPAKSASAWDTPCEGACATGTCDITCSSPATCAAASCPAGFACSIVCEAGGCAGLVISCPESSRFACAVDCSGSASCVNATVECSMGSKCSVTCSGLDACQGASFTCGLGSRCDETCSNGNALPLTCPLGCTSNGCGPIKP